MKKHYIDNLGRVFFVKEETANKNWKEMSEEELEEWISQQQIENTEENE